MNCIGGFSSLAKERVSVDVYSLGPGINGDFELYDMAGECPDFVFLDGPGGKAACEFGPVRENAEIVIYLPHWEGGEGPKKEDCMVVILFISILLMYFILAAQFESFLQPLIVLLEIPIDVAASLLILWICGHTLNLMSAIGIVVTCGIIINDSILKLDAINELRKEGVPLMEAIHEAGRRRLRPIIMTSLTTIFGMVPLLFTFDMGSELQKPLSIAMISAMLIGTVVSLFIIPLVYWFIYRRHAL